MRIGVCSTAKNEHLYINEWVAHYIKLGFDFICVYDNDDPQSPNIRDFIDSQYLKKVKIIDIRGRHEKQLQAKMYSQFYDEYKEYFEWCLFCDIDEFLTGIKDIHEFFGQPQFRNAYQVRVKWKMFNDNNLIERDMTKSVMETFTNSINISGLCNQGKCFVRGGYKNVHFVSVHFASLKGSNQVVPQILPSGRACYSEITIYDDYSHERVYLNHYMTKSLSEFVNQKLNRTDMCFDKRILKLDYYWRINEKTPEKLQFLKEKGLL